MSLIIVIGFWVQSFIGVGHVGYSSFPAPGQLAPDSEWVIAAEAGSITLVQVPYVRYLDFGFNWGFSEFGEGSVVGEGNQVLRLVGRFRFHHCSDQDNFYGIPCFWIGSIPFWLPTMMLAIVAVFARRLFTRSKSDAPQAAS